MAVGSGGGGVGVKVSIADTSRIGVTVGSGSDGTDSAPPLSLQPAKTMATNNKEYSNLLLQTNRPTKPSLLN